MDRSSRRSWATLRCRPRWSHSRWKPSRGSSSKSRSQEPSMKKTPSSRRSADDRGFRLGTGFFALLVVLLVAGIFWELYRTSQLSIAKFGFKFWTGKVWDPVSGEFGALPFIWGTLYSSLLAMLISTPIAVGIAIYLSELSP